MKHKHWHEGWKKYVQMVIRGIEKENDKIFALWQASEQIDRWQVGVCIDKADVWSDLEFSIAFRNKWIKGHGRFQTI